MTRFLLLSLFLSVSCGKIQPLTNSGSGGDPKEISPRFLRGTAEEAELQSVCAALEGKESVLEEMRTLRRVLSVDYGFRNCSGTRFNFKKSASVNAVSFGEYVFVEPSNSLLAIPGAETLSSGVMKEICAQRKDLISPIVSGRRVISYAAFPGFENCPSGNGEVCVQVTYGEMNSDGKTFTPSELHWVSFKTSGSQKGFYGSRMKRTFPENCPNGEESVLVFR